MHFKHGDASSMLQSVDVPWWFLFRKSITFEAIVEDKSTVKTASNVPLSREDPHLFMKLMNFFQPHYMMLLNMNILGKF